MSKAGRLKRKRAKTRKARSQGRRPRQGGQAKIVGVLKAVWSAATTLTMRFFSYLRRLLQRANLAQLWTLKWAARTLALLLSFIVLSVIAMILLMLGLGGFVYVIQNLPYFVFMATMMIVMLGIISLGSIFISTIRNVTVPWITTGSGIRVLVGSVVAIWFVVGFHRVITEKSVSTEFAIAVVLSALLIWVAALAKMFTSKGRYQIGAASVGYVCIIFLYGGIYNLLFLANPTSFVFSPAIIEGEIIEKSFGGELRELRNLQTQIYFGTILEGDPAGVLQAAQNHRNGDTRPQTIDLGLAIRFVWVPDPPGGDEMHLIVIRSGDELDMAVRGRTIRHPEHEQVHDIYFADSEPDIRLKTTALVNTYRDKRNRLSENIESSLSGRPEWGVLEFCYFSSMTQTSAGFGDIMPNNRLIRVIVVSQALVGIVYISFVITFIRSGTRGRVRANARNRRSSVGSVKAETEESI